jgi:hypothetical protein
MYDTGYITEEAAQRIPTTQFRSFDFIPRAGMFLLAGNDLPTQTYPLTEIPDLPKAIWHIDNFGNCKTTLTKFDVKPGETITRYGELPFHTQLRDVPDGTASLTEGSSGFQRTRFVELVMQRGNFAAQYGAKIGDGVFETTSYFRTATA